MCLLNSCGEKMARSIYFPTVELAKNSENNGLATIIHGLIQQNLIDKPEKLADFFKLQGRIAIVAADIEVSLTLEFNRGQLTIHDGIYGIPDLTVRADSEDVINLSLLEVEPRWGLPNPRCEAFRKMLQSTKQGHLKVYGMAAHMLLILRLTRVISVN